MVVMGQQNDSNHKLSHTVVNRRSHHVCGIAGSNTDDVWLNLSVLKYLPQSLSVIITRTFIIPIILQYCWYSNIPFRGILIVSLVYLSLLHKWNPTNDSNSPQGPTNLVGRVWQARGLPLFLVFLLSSFKALYSVPTILLESIPSIWLVCLQGAQRVSQVLSGPTRSVFVRTKGQPWSRLSPIRVSSHVRLLRRESCLVKFDKDGSAEDETYQGGVSRASCRCVGRWWLSRSADTSRRSGSQPWFYLG